MGLLNEFKQMEWVKPYSTTLLQIKSTVNKQTQLKKL
jgi:hypothetical protein